MGPHEAEGCQKAGESAAMGFKTVLLQHVGYRFCVCGGEGGSTIQDDQIFPRAARPRVRPPTHTLTVVRRPHWLLPGHNMVLPVHIGCPQAISAINKTEWADLEAEDSAPEQTKKQ